MTSSVATPKSLARARELVTPVLAAASATLSPELRHIVEYHWGWVDAAGQPLRGAAGKMLRPTLAMLSAEAVGAPATRAGAAAAAVEIIHDFTLLHDDVMDGDRERRHRPTAWTVFGVGPAICGGDALVLLAQRLLLADEGDARADAALALNEAAAEVIAGQVLDLSFEGRLDLREVMSWALPTGVAAFLLLLAMLFWNQRLKRDRRRRSRASPHAVALGQDDEPRDAPDFPRDVATEIGQAPGAGGGPKADVLTPAREQAPPGLDVKGVGDEYRG